MNGRRGKEPARPALVFPGIETGGYQKTLKLYGNNIDIIAYNWIDSLNFDPVPLAGITEKKREERQPMIDRQPRHRYAYFVITIYSPPSHPITSYNMNLKGKAAQDLKISTLDYAPNHPIILYNIHEINK